jgi:hypothetical protein
VPCCDISDGHRTEYDFRDGAYWVPIEGQWMAVAERAIAPQSLTEKAANEMALLREARHARPCAGHPRLCSHQASKTWMAGTKPGRDEKANRFQAVR